jgi:hypothetical protein
VVLGYRDLVEHAQRQTLVRSVLGDPVSRALGGGVFGVGQAESLKMSMLEAWCMPGG